MTAPCGRVLALVDFDRRSHEVIRQASAIARSNGARLALGHLADWEAGVDDFSLLTPSELESRLTSVIHRRLAQLAEDAGTAGARTLVSFRRSGDGLAEMLCGWQPDILVTGDTKGMPVSQDGSSISVPGWTCALLQVHADGIRSFLQALQGRRGVRRTVFSHPN